MSKIFNTEFFTSDGNKIKVQIVDCTSIDDVVDKNTCSDSRPRGSIPSSFKYSDLQEVYLFVSVEEVVNGI